MAKEIERRFICKFIPEGIKPIHIKQGYVFNDKDQQLRVRIIDNKKGSICLKFTQTIVRDEFEYDIPIEDANQIFNQCEYKLTKVRYSTIVEGHHVDIDEYPTGLITAEVELSDEDEEFEKPIYFGKEVTGDNHYSNMSVCKKLKELNND